MQNPRNQSINLILAICLFALTGSAFAEKLGVCKNYQERNEQRCIIKVAPDHQTTMGEQIVLYTADAHWIATGEIIAKKRDYVVALFKEADPMLHNGVKVVFENDSDDDPLNYKMAFAGPES